MAASDDAREALDGIAIIGMAARFPGARNVDELWQNLVAGVESVRSFSEDELERAGVDAATRGNPAFVNSGALAEDLDCFDAAFFGISPREAEIMDPQHRVLLETAWEALERAGYDPGAHPGVIGMFGGVAPNTYREKVLSTRPDLLAKVGDYLAMISSEREYAITRIAYKLDLTGPSLSVNTACSSSAVALHLACQSLLAGENDLCLVGGGRVRAPLTAGYLYQEDGIPSPDGHCRAFDAAARGTAIGNGVGVVVLKRVADALEDGDWIHAVIRATAVNNDGAEKVGFTAPGVAGQSAVIAEALALAGLGADEIDYLEAHGTGTAIGDPLEVAAATQAFRQTSERRGFCGIGSIKTNIGHLDAGAGVAGVIKTALALEREALPPSLNFETPNPEIDFERSPFHVVDRLRPWPRRETPRRAGVSSFGLGGTNAHIVLEEAPEATRPWRPEPGPHLLVWSARTGTALAEATANLRHYLDETPDAALGDVAFTLQSGRRHFAERGALVARDRDDALRALSGPDRRRVLTRAASPARPACFLFPGGGAQYTGMGRALYQREPVFQRALDRCLSLAAPDVDTDLQRLLYPSEGESAPAEESERPSRALPLLFAVEYALAKLWMSWGVEPVALMGHSMGEYTAACLAGVVTLEDALRIVLMRGRLFETLPPGAMLGVPLAASDPRLGADASLSIAAVNRPGACVISGPVANVDRLEAELARQDLECSRVHISVAAHSAMLEPILGEFRDFLGKIAFEEPRIPYVSNVSGTWIREEEARDPEYWVRHLRETVRFADGLETLLAEGENVLIEAGPGQTLCGFARQHPARTRDHVVLPSLPHPRENVADDAFLLGSLGRGWLSGLAVDWRGVQRGEPGRRVPLPTYPFERVRHWVDAGAESVRVGAPRAATHRDESPVATAAPAGPATRKARVLEELCDVIEDLTGFTRDEIDVDQSFLELGFDSLLLTQANNAFRRRFDVPITFRQLFEDTPTPESLAAFIDAELSPDHEVAAPVDRASSPPSEGENESESTPAPRHGPWAPPDTSRTPELSPEQQAQLDALVERAGRTAGSKRFAQAHRASLADPRTAAGYQRLWKDLVYPIVAERAEGARLFDVDGNEWLDISMGFGVTLFGHSPSFVRDAVREQLEHNTAIGPQTALAGEVAELVTELTGLERAAFCNTGSEAVLAAVRAARTVSGRDRIVVFANSYHGLFDEVLVRSGRGGQSVPIAPGIPRSAVEQVQVLEYGEPSSLEVIEAEADRIAAVLVEPIQSRDPERVPREFVRALRRLTEQKGIALIFDEMITGFRLHAGGAQAFYGVRADLATYGKVIGGGLPIGVVAGSAHYLDALDGGHWRYGDDSAPEAGVTWFAGTFVRHPLALAAARAVLLHLKEAGPGLQAELNERSERFREAANAQYAADGVPVRLVGFSSLFDFRFEPAGEFSGLYFHHLRDRFVHCHERRPHFLTTAHGDAEVAEVLAALGESARAMRKARFWPAETGAPSEQRVPATDAQKEIWLAACVDDDASRAFQLSTSIDLVGALDREGMQRAIAALAERHAALRTSIDRDGETQRIASRSRVELREIDLGDLDPDARQAELAKLHSADAAELFALERGALVRFALVRLGERAHRLIVTAHHVVCDGWSMGILIRDLGALYRREVSAGDGLGAAPEFGDFARERAARQESRSGEATRDDWLEKLAGELPVLELPTDRERPATKTYAGDQQGITLDEPLLAELRQVAAGGGGTLFATLLGSYAVLLKRLASTDEVLVGVAAAGQPVAGAPDLVGHCVNLYPFRSRAPRSAPLPEHLAEMQRALVDSLDAPDTTYGSLIERLALPRDPSRLPLLSTMVTYESETKDVDFGALEFTVRNNPKRFCNFDLELYLTESSSGLRVDFHYNTDLFDAATIRRWLESYRVLLDSLARRPEALAAELPLAGSEERALMAEWSRGAQLAPAAESVPAWFETAAARYADRGALVFPATGERMSYRELDTRANQLAQHLRGLGAGVGDRVGLCLERGPEQVVALLAILKTGAAYVPFDPGFPPERLAYMLADAHVRVLVSRERLVDALELRGAPLCCLDREREAIASAAATSPALPAGPESCAYVIYTSGSTGRPKGVEIPQRALVNFLTSMAQTPGLGVEDRLLAVTTLSFDIAALELLLPLVSGAELVLASDDDVVDGVRLAELMAEYRVSVMQATPATWRLLLEAGWSGSDALRVLCGGETLPAELAERLLPRCASLWNLYGPTETTIWSTLARVVPAAECIVIGRPIANTTVELLDEHGHPAPLGAVGELCIGGAGVALGYLNRPELTRERFVDSASGERLFRTGDFARWLPGGELECLGRRDDQIKLRGFRIELGEIESVLAQHPGVLAAAVALSGEGEDARLAAYVVASPDAHAAPGADALRAHLRQRLPDYMVPALYVGLPALPLTPNRKLDRGALPDAERLGVRSERSVRLPESATERAVAEIWCELLKCERVGLDDDFFDLGGYSLLAARLAARLRDRFSVELPLRRLFESPTLGGLSEIVDALCWRRDQGDTPAAGGDRVEIDL